MGAPKKGPGHLTKHTHAQIHLPPTGSMVMSHWPSTKNQGFKSPNHPSKPPTKGYITFPFGQPTNKQRKQQQNRKQKAAFTKLTNVLKRAEKSISFCLTPKTPSWSVETSQVLAILRILSSELAQ